MNSIYDLSTLLLPMILAITARAVVNGYVARQAGDPTAAEAGRLSLNPLVHVDWIGTVLLPGVLFLAQIPPIGWAKPVPVDVTRFGNPRQDTLWLAASGPAANLFLAIVAALLLNVGAYLDGVVGQWIIDMLRMAVIINVVFLVFNLIPIPPLDGGNIVLCLLPEPLARSYARLYPYGVYIVFGLILVPVLLGSLFGGEYNVVLRAIWSVVMFLYNGIVNLLVFVV